MVKKFRGENPGCRKGSELAGRKLFRALQRAQRLDEIGTQKERLLRLHSAERSICDFTKRRCRDKAQRYEISGRRKGPTGC
jgi:hypothetical protein